MPTTVNNTLPLNWDASISYNLGDEVSFGNNIIYRSLQGGNRNHIPSKSEEWWKPLDIYKKDETVMPHGDYSGDESFWERDNIYIDNGWVYVNGENTGINVRGPGASTVTFDELTPEQIEQLRGQRGPQGEQGPQGETGPEGPMGEVTLTPEQVAALKGDPGKSAYQVWLDNGHSGSEEDFLQWLRKVSIIIDDELLSNSPNPVANRAIYQAFMSYQTYLSRVVQEYASRVTALENRLKATYNNQEHDFIFGITDNGKYGYRQTYDTRVIPFDNTEVDVSQSDEIFASNLISDMQHEQYILDPVIETIGNNTPTFLGTSMTRAISNKNDLDVNENLYSTIVTPQSFDEFANTKTYIYNHGNDLTYNVPGYQLYQMNELTSEILSKGQENIEGIMLSNKANNYGYKVTFKVAPYIEGTPINYEIGLASVDGTLPSIVSGTKRIDYSRGSFDTETEISYLLTANTDRKVYFASNFTPSPWESFPAQYEYVHYPGADWKYYDIEEDFGVDLSQYDQIRITTLQPKTDSGIFNISEITTTTKYFSGDEMNKYNGIRINPTTGRYELFPNRGGHYYMDCKKADNPSKYKITEIYVE